MSAGARHRGSFTHQFLVGITSDIWRNILRENAHQYDPRYFHRVAFLSLMSVINSLYREQEERDFGAAVERTSVDASPIFILGHWRSGTTFLHNLLVRDEEQFAFPTTYQASFPHTFLTTEQTIPRIVERWTPKTRRIDNMAFRLDLPQEDEFAICAACGYSSLLGMVFPRRVEHYDRYLDMRTVPADERERWKQTLHWFLRKLTYRYGRTLVLKSPQHTARIKLLLDMFPKARFIHITRNPYAIFQSCRHMYDTMVWHTYLQKPDTRRIDRDILRRYNTMYEAYFEERSLIPPGQLYELRFEDLRRDPVGQVRAIYEALGLPISPDWTARTDSYVRSLSDYRQNGYHTLSDTQRQKVQGAWNGGFERWGYAA
jgi:omega-hydroxy-beta-dihydromenaquinone-9 sulfotransferase